MRVDDARRRNKRVHFTQNAVSAGRRSRLVGTPEFDFMRQYSACLSSAI